MNALALSLIGLLGLQGPPEHGFDEPVYVATLIAALEDPDVSSETADAVLDALAPHAAHPAMRAAAPRLLRLATEAQDHELAGRALRLIGERGAPVSRQMQSGLLSLVHPHWRCLGFAPPGVTPSPKRSGCGDGAWMGRSTPAGRVAGWAAWATARVGPDRSAVAKVLTLLLLSPDDFTRHAAIDGLTHLGAEGLPLLEHAMVATKDDGVGVRLAEAWSEAVARASPPIVPRAATLRHLAARARAARTPRLRRVFLQARLRVARDHPHVVAEAVAELLESRDYFLMRNIATLGATASAALPAVLAAAESSDSVYAAVDALERIVPEGDRPSVAARLAPLLDGDASYSISRVLERLGPPGLRTLQDRLRTGRPELRRQLAGMRREAPTKRKPSYESVFDSQAWQSELTDRLGTDEDPEVRATIAASLKTPAGCEALLRQAEVETAPVAFAGLARGLAGCGAPAAPVLLDWANADPPVGPAARAALSEVPAPVEPALTALLGPADAKPRRRFARGGRSIEDRRAAAKLGARAVPHLAARMAAPAAQVRSDAAYVLGLIGAPAAAAVPALARALDDEEEDVRQWAAWALGHLEDPAAAPDLVSATTDPSRWVRRNAAAALVQIGAPLEDLQLVLADNDDAVAEAAIEALGRAPRVDPAHASRLLERLSGDNAQVQRAAARALARMRHASPDLQARLRALMSAEKPRVRWAAAEALLMVGTPEDIVPALVVRRAAPKAAEKEDQEAMRRLGEMLR